MAADKAVGIDGGACAFEISMTFAEFVWDVTGDEDVVVESTTIVLPPWFFSLSQ